MRVRVVLLSFVLLAGACGDGDAADPGVDTGSSTTSTRIEPTTGVDPTLPIALCEEIEVPEPNVIGTLPGGQNLDDELTGVVLTYISEHEDTYGGRWIDRDHGGTFVIAFTDDPAPHLEELLSRRPSESDIAAIEPRPPITGTWTVAESGYAVDVVQVEHTEAELRSLQAELGVLLDRDDLQIEGLGSGSQLNRVSLFLIRPTMADLELLATLVPVDMVCVEGPLTDESMAPPSVDEPLTVMADAGDDPLVSCGSGPFRQSALDGTPDIDPDTDDPAEIVLLAGDMEGFGVPQTGWRTLARTENDARFGNFDNAAPSQIILIHQLRNTDAGWTLAGTSAGGCEMRLVVPDGVGIASVGLDPENPVDPTSTTLQLLVTEQACSSGSDPTERLRPPEVIETDDEVRIAVALVALEGFHDCQGNPSIPLTIELRAVLGDRALLDGLRVPPEPLADLGL